MPTAEKIPSAKLRLLNLHGNPCILKHNWGKYPQLLQNQFDFRLRIRNFSSYLKTQPSCMTQGNLLILLT